jgi:hypothetical protein
MADTILALTVSGQALKAKIEQGNGLIPLEITRIVSASGVSHDPINLTALIDPKLEFSITNVSTQGARTTISAALSNMGDSSAGIPPLAAGYPMSQVGFYAIDPDEGEILYRISQYDNPIYIPAAQERGWTYTPSFNIVTGNATTVIIEINAAGYAPMSALTSHIEDTVASAAGVHSIRFYDDKLQIWNGSEWLNVSLGTSNTGQFSIADGVLSNTILYGSIAPNETANTFTINPGLAAMTGETLYLL